MSLKGAVSHFKTVSTHRKYVRQYCFRAGLIKQGLLHDLSKYSPTEFLVGAKYYQGNMSPNNAERNDIGVSTSWLHHKGRNKHHFEYRIDYASKISDPQHILVGAKMPRRYVAEMIFDRVSASRTYLGDAYTDQKPLEYFLASRKYSWFVHPDTMRQMEYLLRMWAVKGEEETIRYIREVFLAGKGRRSGRNGKGTR